MNDTACITIVRHMALRWTSKYARVIYSNCRILQTFISLVENLLYNAAFYFASRVPAINLMRARDRSPREFRSPKRRTTINKSPIRPPLRTGSVPFFFLQRQPFLQLQLRSRSYKSRFGEPSRGASVPLLSAGGRSLSLSFSQSCRGMTYKHYTSECDTLLPLYICTIMRHSYPHGYNRALSLPVHVIASLRLYVRSTTRPRRLLSTCLRKPSKAILQRKKIYNYVLNARSTCVC